MSKFSSARHATYASASAARQVSVLQVAVAVAVAVPVALALAALGPGAARAASFTIADGDVAGLIAAIQQANSMAGAHTIDLAPAGTYTLTSVQAADLGLPAVTGQVTLNGRGSTIQRSSAPATPAFRILQVEFGQLVLNEVQIRGGQGGYGAGLMNYRGSLTVSRSTVSNNDGQGPPANPFGEGAGIYNLCG